MVSSPTTRTCWLLILGLLLLRIAGAKKLALHLAREEELEQLEELVRLLPDEPDKDRELVAALRKLQLDAEQVMRHRQRASGSDEPEVVLMQDHLHQEQQARHRWEVYKHVTKPDTDNYEYTGTKKPVIIYPKGKSESELPLCRDKNEVCSKVDIYDEPWIERLCRCPGSRKCSRNVSSKDGHTIVDRTKHYKLCEPVKRLPTCRYFKDTYITMKAPNNNGTISINIYCKCRPGSTAYITRSANARGADGGIETTYYFSCSPQSRIKCKNKKDPCRLFSVRSMDNYPSTDVTVSRLCECPRGHSCPRHYDDLGSTAHHSQQGNKLYNGHCMPNVLVPIEPSNASRKKQQQQRYSVLN